MRKSFVIVLFVVIGLVVFYFGNSAYSFYSRGWEGEILQTSLNAKELLNTNSQFMFLDGNIKECKWYYQIANRNGNWFVWTEERCYNGEIILTNDYFDHITTKYNWYEYDYREHIANLDEFEIVLHSMYQSSMLRNSLESKDLYVCDDTIFTDRNLFFTFLDKESKKLYFYKYAL
jgi:hypothetical protein